MRDDYVRPIDFRTGRVDLTHGGGGRAMAQLIDELFVRAFDNKWLRQANDQAAFAVRSGRMVMATDSHVVSPLFFPGGDIGSLAVHGTVNDVAMSGARPLYLSAGFIIEEGFPLADLQRIAHSMGVAARTALIPSICLTRSAKALDFMHDKVPGIVVPEPLRRRVASASASRSRPTSPLPCAPRKRVRSPRRVNNCSATRQRLSCA